MFLAWEHSLVIQGSQDPWSLFYYVSGMPSLNLATIAYRKWAKNPGTVEQSSEKNQIVQELRNVTMDLLYKTKEFTVFPRKVQGLLWKWKVKVTSASSV
jgi:hypothetical protein